MNNNSIIASSIILPSIIISITLLLQRSKVSHRFLSIFYLLQLVLLTLSSLILSNYKYMNLFPIGHLGNLFTFCMAPTIYLYIKKYLSKSKSIKIHDLLNKFNNEGKIISTQCLSGIILGNAGLLQGKKVTGWPTIEGDIPGIKVQ